MPTPRTPINFQTRSLHTWVNPFHYSEFDQEKLVNFSLLPHTIRFPRVFFFHILDTLVMLLVLSLS